jgi:hypothetical protein
VFDDGEVFTATGYAIPPADETIVVISEPVTFVDGELTLTEISLVRVFTNVFFMENESLLLFVDYTRCSKCFSLWPSDSNVAMYHFKPRILGFWASPKEFADRRIQMTSCPYDDMHEVDKAMKTGDSRRIPAEGKVFND